MPVGISYGAVGVCRLPCLLISDFPLHSSTPVDIEGIITFSPFTFPPPPKKKKQKEIYLLTISYECQSGIISDLPAK